MAKIWKILTRKKVIDPISAEETRLSRVLNTFDLTALGVGSTLGVGVYVLAGQVARNIAGPSVVLSFFIAALASIFAGLCYAEFGARAPKAGSAYIYSYVCVGEFVAFVIGWNLILEYVIGSASVARGMTEYFDMLLNNTLRNAFTDFAPINVPYLSEYFDFFSFGISVLLSIALAFGLKESTMVNNIFTTINIFVVLFVIIAGSIKADTANWDIQPANSTANSTDIGKGGFFPFGVEGMIKGAATCFYGFVGFDCIATTGEEVQNPKRAIPISIIVSLFIVFLAYFGTSTVVTLMVPYYLQNENAPIPYAFEHIGWEWAKWIVSIGGIFGLCASLFGAMFPLPRIIYAMADDGLVFKFLGKISPKFRTPVIGTLLEGLLTGLMAAIFDLKQLVSMMSIGTLLAYTIVAACVLRLRYANEEVQSYLPVQTTSDSDDGDIHANEEVQSYLPVQTKSDPDDCDMYTDNGIDMPPDSDRTNDENELLSYDSSDDSSVIGQIFNCGRYKNPTKISESIVAVEVLLYCLTCFCIGLCILCWNSNIINGDMWAISVTSVCVLIAVLLVMSMATQPTSKKELSFKVPMVPLIPATSILINVYLMLMLDSHTWIRFAVWMILGLPIYYFSLRPYTEAQISITPIDDDSTISKNDDTTIPRKENGMVNFYNNIAFEADELTNEITQPKKKPAPPPPVKTEDKIEVLEIQQELKKLDEMLDEVDINLSNSERKLSIDGLSYVSDVVPCEESVVAVVHRDNVVTPAESIITPFFPKSSDMPATIVPSELLQNDDVLNDNNEDNNVDSPMPPDTPSPSGSDDDKTDFSLDEISPAPTPPPSLNDFPLLETKEMAPPPPLPPPLPSTENKNIEDFSPHKITSGYLNSVRLRPKKKEENKEEKTVFEPEDENLKVTSEKTKTFMKNLEGTLKRITLGIPSYIAVQPRENIIAELPENSNNENVIVDSINRNEAKEKFVSFVNSRLGNKNDNNEEKPKVKNKEMVGEQIAQTKDESKENESDDAFITHKNRMKNVFRSIHLPRMENSDKGVEDSSRNFKSLGHVNDDKTKHRQAMGQIFKNIELRGKDSQK